MNSNNKPQLSGPCANPQCPFGGMAPSLHTCPCCHKNIHLPCGKETPDFKFVLCPICERQLEYQREAKRGRPAELKQNYHYSPPAKKYRELREAHAGLGDPVARAYLRCHRASETDSNSRSDTTPTATLTDQEPSVNTWQSVGMLLTQVSQLKQELRQVKQELTDVRAENKSSYRKLLRALKTHNDNLRTDRGETANTNNAASDTAASIADASGVNNIGTATADGVTHDNTSGGPTDMEPRRFPVIASIRPDDVKYGMAPAASSSQKYREVVDLLSRKKTFSFPWIFHQLLSDVEQGNDEHVISWLPGGKCFKVHDRDAFVTRILPIYFRQKSFKSFLRQLYHYGFDRMKARGKEKGAYFHPLFIKGHRELTLSIETREGSRRRRMQPPGA